MKYNRMRADGAPRWGCTMPKVSGSRLATPLAPPSPGSTPMITPRITPMNIRPTMAGVRATPNPCISDWISSMSAQAEEVFQRPLGQRHLEPLLEHQVEHDRRAGAHRQHLPPRVLPEPAHEEADVQDRRQVDADPADQRGEHGGRHEDR